MPYCYTDDYATADVAFEAWGGSLPELFAAACDATLNVMVARVASIEPRLWRRIRLHDEALELLLFRFLNEIIYLKDAKRLLLRAPELEVQTDDGWALVGKLCGEYLNEQKHELLVDVKAATLHRLAIAQEQQGWHASVVLDV